MNEIRTSVKVIDVWDQFSHIYYEIFYNGIHYILSKPDLDIYLAVHNLIAEIEIDHRYPCWYNRNYL